MPRNKKSKNVPEEQPPPAVDYTIPCKDYGDLYCIICESHMNSDDMWQAHIKGKKHIKNVKKGGDEDTKKYETLNTEASIMKSFNEIDTEPVIGLGHIDELYRIDSPGPIFMCYLCNSNMAVAELVVDHVLGYKHRFAYMNKHAPHMSKEIDHFNFSKSAVESLVKEQAIRLEQEFGRGVVTVRKEKPKTDVWTVGKRPANAVEDKSRASAPKKAKTSRFSDIKDPGTFPDRYYDHLIGDHRNERRTPPITRHEPERELPSRYKDYRRSISPRGQRSGNKASTSGRKHRPSTSRRKYSNSSSSESSDEYYSRQEELNRQRKDELHMEDLRREELRMEDLRREELRMEEELRRDEELRIEDEMRRNEELRREEMRREEMRREEMRREEMRREEMRREEMRREDLLREELHIASMNREKSHNAPGAHERVDGHSFTSIYEFIQSSRNAESMKRFQELEKNVNDLPRAEYWNLIQSSFASKNFTQEDLPLMHVTMKMLTEREQEIKRTTSNRNQMNLNQAQRNSNFEARPHFNNMMSPERLLTPAAILSSENYSNQSPNRRPNNNADNFPRPSTSQQNNPPLLDFMTILKSRANSTSGSADQRYFSVDRRHTFEEAVPPGLTLEEESRMHPYFPPK